MPAVVVGLTAMVGLADPLSFQSGVSGGTIQTSIINEASGLAASRQNPNVLWTHNDSGDSARLFAVNTAGAVHGIYSITGASATDWEDMATAPDPVSGVHYLYIGDIGDNSAVRGSVTVYRVPEPVVATNVFNLVTNIAGVEAYTMTYSDGARDAETLMVDPLNGDVIVVSKREAVARTYRVAYPQSTNTTNTLQFEGELTYGLPVGGDISPSGRQILIKQYAAAWYYSRATNETIASVLTNAGASVPCASEPQGEAIAWHGRERGYYTLSEGVSQPVYWYASDDSDGDGLVDSAEVAAGTDMDLADTDGDGQADGDEVISGMDPTSSNSFFSAEVWSASETLTLQWDAVTGRTYTIERATNLFESTPFIALVSNITVAVSQTLTTNVALDGEAGLYRVRAQRLSEW